MTSAPDEDLATALRDRIDQALTELQEARRELVLLKAGSQKALNELPRTRPVNLDAAWDAIKAARKHLEGQGLKPQGRPV